MLLIVLLGEVLHDCENGFLVVIMVNNLDVICLNIDQVNVLNWFSSLFGEILNDG